MAGGEHRGRGRITSLKRSWPAGARIVLPRRPFQPDSNSSSKLPVGAIHELPLQRRRDVLVTSAVRRWIVHSPSPGTTSVPLRPSGGTCLSGPSLDVGSSIPPSAGTTSVPLRPFGGTCLSGPLIALGSCTPIPQARRALYR